MNEKKVIRKHFNLADFEEEQNFLASLHSKGWRLISVKTFRYTFEKCSCEDVTYQIDFNPKEREKEEYIQLLRDFGWQVIAEKNGKFYFTKTTSLIHENESKLFSDMEAKASMCKKIVKYKLLWLLPLSVIMILISSLIGSGLFLSQSVPVFICEFISGVILFGLILTTYINYLVSYFKLNKMMRGEEQVDSISFKLKSALLIIIAFVAIIGGLCLNFNSFLYGHYSLKNGLVTICFIMIWGVLLLLGHKSFGLLLFAIVYWTLTLLSAITARIAIYTDASIDWILLLFVPTSGALSGLGFWIGNYLWSIAAIILISAMALFLSFILLLKRH